MIVVDSSAVAAVLFEEVAADAAQIERLLLTEACVMSAATRVELGMVIEAKAGPLGTQLLEELLVRAGIEILAVDEELAFEALVGWRRFGKGRHSAGLNYGDVFSYALARQLGCPLLFVGDDFSKTDVEARLGAPPPASPD